MSDTIECSSGKTPYPSRKKALKVLNAQRRSIHKWGSHGRKGDGAVTTYRCDECGEYHLTKAAYRKRSRKDVA